MWHPLSRDGTIIVCHAVSAQRSLSSSYTPSLPPSVARAHSCSILSTAQSGVANSTRLGSRAVLSIVEGGEEEWRRTGKEGPSSILAIYLLATHPQLEG